MRKTVPLVHYRNDERVVIGDAIVEFDTSVENAVNTGEGVKVYAEITDTETLKKFSPVSEGSISVHYENFDLATPQEAAYIPKSGIQITGLITAGEIKAAIDRHFEKS